MESQRKRKFATLANSKKSSADSAPTYAHSEPSLDDTSSDEDIYEAKANQDTALNTPTTNNHNSRQKRAKRRAHAQSTTSERLARKMAKNAGISYKTVQGNEVRPRQRKKLANCRMKCAERLSDEKCESLHVEYWKLDNINLKRLFLTPLISVNPKQRIVYSDCCPSKKKNRQLSLKYCVKVDDRTEPICKRCFQNIFDVSNKLIEVIVRKKLETTAGTLEDKILHHPFNQNLTNEKLAKVRAHLHSFPAYESHYSGNKKKFLPAHLNLALMYKLYTEKYPDNAVSRWIYEKEFYNLGLSIKEPKAEVCKTCDYLELKHKTVKTEEERKDIRIQQDAHQSNAFGPYESKSADISTAKCSKNRTIVAAFDMQQCLPTPSLPTVQIFYSRQLWTYNLTCHNCTNGKSHNYMWHEAVASGGANQVASCIFNFLMSLPTTTEHVTFYSNSCRGRNKNSIMSAMFFFALQSKPSLKIIDHKFFYPGHTRNECDADHAAIERARKKTEHIYVPRDYYNMVRNMGGKYEVTVMNSEKHLNFADLLVNGPLKKPIVNAVGEPFGFGPVQWMRYNHTVCGLVQYKVSMAEEEEFLLLDMRKTNYTPRLEVRRLRTLPRPIKREKKEDLMKLLEFVDEDSREFYERLEIKEDELPDSDVGSTDEEDEALSVNSEESGTK